MNLKIFTTLLLMLLTLAACGKKGPVRPKLLPLPAAPANLTVEQRGAHFLLSWDIPRLNQDGSPFEPENFRILRMRYQPADECVNCRDDFSVVGEVDLNYLQGVRRIGERLFWWDEEPAVDYAYRYQVLATTATGRAGAAAQVHRLCVVGPPSPLNLQAEGFDQLIRLKWEPPAEIPGQLVGYKIYRWEPDNPLPLQALGERSAAENSFEDFGLENGRTFLFAVSTVSDIRGYRTESLPTEPVAAAPQAGR